MCVYLVGVLHLTKFGIATDQQCHVCIGGRKKDNHIFLHCHYSKHVLQTLLSKVRVVSVVTYG